MMLVMVVKGNEAQARKAARVHGFDAKGLESKTYASPAGSERLETRLTFHAARPVHEGLAVAWFNEPGEAPYADGALLFYSAA